MLRGFVGEFVRSFWGCLKMVCNSVGCCCFGRCSVSFRGLFVVDENFYCMFCSDIAERFAHLMITLMLEITPNTTPMLKPKKWASGTFSQLVDVNSDDAK